MTISAIFARLRRAISDSASPVYVPGYQTESADTSGHARTAPQPLNFGGNPPPINIKARALRLHNRNASQASIYERKHVILAEGLRK